VECGGGVGAGLTNSGHFVKFIWGGSNLKYAELLFINLNNFKNKK
jgi:hypothetical protein